MTAPVVVGSHHDVSAPIRAGHRRVHRASHPRWRAFSEREHGTSASTRIFPLGRRAGIPGGGGGGLRPPWPWPTGEDPRWISSSAAACSSPWDRPVSPHPQDPLRRPPRDQVPAEILFRFSSPLPLPSPTRRTRAPRADAHGCRQPYLPPGTRGGRRHGPAMGRRRRRLGDPPRRIRILPVTRARPRRGKR